MERGNSSCTKKDQRDSLDKFTWLYHEIFRGGQNTAHIGLKYLFILIFFSVQKLEKDEELLYDVFLLHCSKTVDQKIWFHYLF